MFIRDVRREHFAFIWNLMKMSSWLICVLIVLFGSGLLQLESLQSWSLGTDYKNDHLPFYLVTLERKTHLCVYICNNMSHSRLDSSLNSGRSELFVWSELSLQFQEIDLDQHHPPKSAWVVFDLQIIYSKSLSTQKCWSCLNKKMIGSVVVCINY